ncbi:hypothetical protein N2152v2_010609 [Parachlorella kessleri]
MEPPSTVEVTSLQFPASDPSNPVKTTGLHRAPLSAGVKNATLRYDLPSPAVAVRNLVEQANYAHLCTIMSGMHHRRAGYPFGTLVDFAADGGGYPIFSLSPLAIQTRNIMEDPRCSLVVQMPGWTGLANARVTIFGDVYKLSSDLQDAAQEIFHQKHAAEKKGRWVSGNAVFFRMNRILDIYFVGGFGTVQWVDVEEYTSVQPDKVVLETPNHTLQVLNEQYSGQLRQLLGQPEREADDAVFISVDKLGADIRVRKGGDYLVERVGFDRAACPLTQACLLLQPVECLLDAQQAVQRLLTEQEARRGVKR